LSKQAKELREKRAALAAEAQALIKKDGVPQGDREKFDEIMGNVDALKGDIDRIERAETLEAELRSSNRPPNNPIGNDPSKKADKERFQELQDEYRVAYWESMRRPGNDHEARLFSAGMNGRNVPILSEENRRILDSAEHRFTAQFGRFREYRDMGVGSPTASIPTSVLVPQGFVQDLEVALKWYGDMLNVGTILETASGQPLPYPTMNDTTISGEVIGESSQVSGAAVGGSIDINVSNILLGAWKYSTKMVHVSLELLQDSAFNVEQFVKEAFAIRLGRILNTHFTKGSGSSQPNGLITVLVNGSEFGVGGNSGTATIGDDNATTPDPAHQVGYYDLVNLEHSVDRAYRKGSKYMFHDYTLQFLKKLKDKYGRPLWVPGVTTNAPDTIVGYPYSVNNDMDNINATSPTTTRNTVAFGRLDKYLIRRVKDLAILRLVERFAEYGQVAFIGFARYDGNLLDAGTHPVKLLQNPTG
jgi:HK97 family phage major capsid protein